MGLLLARSSLVPMPANPKVHASIVRVLNIQLPRRPCLISAKLSPCFLLRVPCPSAQVLPQDPKTRDQSPRPTPCVQSVSHSAAPPTQPFLCLSHYHCLSFLCSLPSFLLVLHLPLQSNSESGLSIRNKPLSLKALRSFS